MDNENKEPIIGGSVELLKTADSLVVAGTVSNASGEFAIRNLTASKYIVKVSYLGYKTFLKNIELTSKNSQLILGELLLETNDVLLKEMVVTGKKPDVSVKNDTLEFDAESVKTTENAVVEDVLKKMSGVEVDKDGAITVAGKEVKKIMVDGKEFFSNDPKVASKNLPAAMIEKVQVYDRKSDQARMTGFDDGEEETIINLTVRPGMKQGTLGNVLAGLGQDVEKNNDTRYQAGAFVNHMQNSNRATLILGANNNNNMGASDLGSNQFGGMRMRRGSEGIAETKNFMLNVNKAVSPKLSVNGDLLYNESDRNSLNEINQTTLSEVVSKSQLDKKLTNTNYFTRNVSANFSLEWNPDSLNSLIFRQSGFGGMPGGGGGSPVFGYNQSHSSEMEEAVRFNYDNMDTISHSTSNTYNRGDGYSLNGNLDYAHKFANKQGRVLSFGLRGSHSDNFSQERTKWNSRNFIDGVYSYDSYRNQRMENDDNYDSYRFNLSYVEPVGHNNFIQALYRYSYAETKSINSTYDILENDPYLYATLLQDSAFINENQSRSTLRNSTEQRYGLSFKSVRKKYNYTVGFNVDPSNSVNETYQPSNNSAFSLLFPSDLDHRLENVMSDSLISSIPLDVVNFSPVVNYNYIFSARSNLRIDYEGQTNQPSAMQLRDYVDQSRPRDWTQGNPSLKPGYVNSLRARLNKYVPETQLMYNFNLDGRYSLNDITQVTHLMDTVRLTTYENVNGNWNLNFMGMFNTPLKNKKFSIGNFFRTGYTNRNSFIDDSKNTMKNLSINDRLNINYRSDLFDIGINGNINYNNITYSLRQQDDQNTYNYGVGAFTTWYLPYNWSIESDINYTKRSGYAAGYNVSETLWNAAITKQVFNKRYGTGSIKAQVFDILQNRNSIMASSTTNGYQTQKMTVIPSYFMCSFIYKFSIFPKTSIATESNIRGEDRWRGGPPPGAGGGRPPF
ncbi:collagen-binding protein [Bacteroidia bacterium]|nr:collagen-binding protein [Bacteroidia bacterium]